MKRSMGLVILFAAAAGFAVSGEGRTQDKPRPKAAVYKTPQECFTAYVAAEAKDDFRTLAPCMAPEFQQGMALGVTLELLTYREPKDAKSRDVAELFKPVFAVLDSHGLTKKATQDVKLSKDPKERQKADKAILALIKDPEALLIDLLSAIHKITGGNAGKKTYKQKMTDVKIDGDKASGIVIVMKTAEEKQPVSFVKIDGGWRLISPINRRQKEKPKDNKPDDKPKDNTPPLKTTAEVLSKEFHDDAAAATKKYASKTVEVTGLVMIANKSTVPSGFSLIGGKAKPKDAAGEIFCEMKKEQFDRAWWLGQRQKVKVVGRFKLAFTGTYIQLTDCTIVELTASVTQKTTAKQLTADFVKDNKAAVKKYVGNAENTEIIVEGTVVDKKEVKDTIAAPYLVYLEGEGEYRVECAVKAPDFKKLKKGDKVTIKGFCLKVSLSDLDKTVFLTHVFVLPPRPPQPGDKPGK